MGTTIRVCGGWVRDKLLGLHSNDIDINIDNMGCGDFVQQICEELNQGRIEKVTFGISDPKANKLKNIQVANMTVDGASIDVCCLRKEWFNGEKTVVSTNATP